MAMLLCLKLRVHRGDRAGDQGSCENFDLKKFYLKISLKTKTSYGFFR